jgi:Uma2 family endonuclease
MTQHFCRDEFRQWAEGRKGRYDLVAGVPVAMMPEPVIHVRLKCQVWAALDRAIRAAGLDCEALGDGITVEVGDDTDYEPDAVVNQGPPVHPDAFAARSPVIVVEVLWLLPQSMDTTDKLADYFRIPSIQYYQIVRARRREIVHHYRSGDGIVSWVVNLGSIRLDPAGIVLDIGEVYAGTA